MVMHFGTKKKQCPYFMPGEQLLVTKEERGISVTVSNTLKPSTQCAKAARTAGAVLGQLARAFYYRDRHNFIGLYEQYVLPHLEFAVQSWCPWTAKDKEIPSNPVTSSGLRHFLNFISKKPLAYIYFFPGRKLSKFGA